MFWLYVIDIKGLIDSNVILFKFYFECDEFLLYVNINVIVFYIFLSPSRKRGREKEQRQLKKIIYFKIIEDLNIVKCFANIKVALIHLLKH